MTSVAFGPKGTTILTGSTDGGVRVHAAEDGKVLHTLGTHADFVHAVAHSTKALAASGSDDGVVRLWSVRTRKLVRTWTIEAKRAKHRFVWALRFNRAATRLYAALGDGTIRVFDVGTGKEVRRFVGHEKRVLAIDLDADETRLASSSSDKTVRVWDVATGKLRTKLGGHAKTVYAVAWHPGGRWLASGSLDGTIRIWDPKAGLVKQRLDAHKEGVYGLAFTSDGKRLAAACGGGVARLYAQR